MRLHMPQMHNVAPTDAISCRLTGRRRLATAPRALTVRQRCELPFQFVHGPALPSVRLIHLTVPLKLRVLQARSHDETFPLCARTILGGTHTMDEARALNEEAIFQRRRTKLHGRAEGTMLAESMNPRASDENKTSHNDQAVTTITSFSLVMSFLMLFERLLVTIRRLPPLFLSGEPPKLLPKVPPKPDTWRIQGIHQAEKDVATKWLRGKAEGLRYPKGQGFSLAADSEKTLCATLTSSECPTIPDGRGWHLDEDLIGFTPLDDPEDAELDIFAITGLGGHALGSFRSTDGRFIWLRDFGPSDVQKARFITYSYNTKVVASKSTKGVAALASTLLDGLINFRCCTQTQQ